MNSLEITTELDSNFANTYVSREYPYIYLNPKNASPLPVVIDLLEEGKLPIVFEFQGESYEVKRVDPSPLNLRKLLKVYPFEISLSKEKTIKINSTTDLLEVSKWMRQSS